MSGADIDFSTFLGDKVLSLAANNGIAPLLCQHLETGQVTGLSDLTARQLTDYSRTSATQDLLLNNDTKNLLKLLADNGIPALLLKGTPLSLLVYEKPYLRERCDTDMYIPQDTVEDTTRLLEDNGYTVHNLGQRTHASKQFQARIQSFQQYGSTFDIHYRLSNRVLFQTTLPFGECWREKQAIPALGPQAWALSNRDLLIHACIHRIAHGRGTERNRLLWLWDIQLLWQTMDDTQKHHFVKKALAKKIGALCADALIKCNELFNSCKNGESGDPARATATAIQSWISALQKNQKSEPTASLINASKPRWALADLMAIVGVKNKLAFINEILRK